MVLFYIDFDIRTIEILWNNYFLEDAYMNPQILIEITKVTAENPVLNEKNLVENNSIRLASTSLIFNIPKNNPQSELQKQRLLNELEEIQNHKKQFYQLCETKNLNQIRGGGKITEASWLFLTIWMIYQQKTTGFIPSGTTPPPHLNWLYPNHKPGIGYGKEAGPRSIHVTGATQNASSKKSQASNGSVKIVSLIEKDSRLAKEAAIMGKNQAVQREANHLIEQLSKGNFNPGTETRNLFNDVCYLRGNNGARIFYRRLGEVVQILAKSSKSNEQTVINILTKKYK